MVELTHEERGQVERHDDVGHLQAPALEENLGDERAATAKRTKVDKCLGGMKKTKKNRTAHRTTWEQREGCTA